MTGSLKSSCKAVGGAFSKAYGFVAPRTLPLIFSILFPSASCWKALTCCPEVQAYHAAWVLKCQRR